MGKGKQETRTWPTPYRGIVLICSSAIPYGDRELIEICGPEQYARILQVLGPKWFNVVKRGSALFVGRLTGVVNRPINPDYKFYNEEVKKREDATFVKYSPSLCIHLYEDITPIQPFVWKGCQGWKTLNPEEKNRIKIL